MLRSCSYCGRIHKRSHECASKPKSTRELTHIDKFRKTRQWQNMRKYIAERDKYLCQICLHDYNEYTTKSLEVHHIVPMAEDFDRRLDEENLITLCRYHHEMAEKGEITREKLFLITKSPGVSE